MNYVVEKNPNKNQNKNNNNKQANKETTKQKPKKHQKTEWLKHFCHQHVQNNVFKKKI